MKPFIFFLFLACEAAFSHAPAMAGSVGFAMLSIPDGSGAPIEAGVWYPTTAITAPTPVGPFIQTVAANAPVAGANHPLVVMSHGTGGDFTGNSDTAMALAEAGFVVAALTHAGDNPYDESKIMDPANRPRQLDVLIEYMVNEWPARAVDAHRIGAFGFSYGGFTVLVTAGGEPDLSLTARHCMEHPEFFTCKVAAAHRGEGLGFAAPARQFIHDRRIRALVVAAPAFGFAFTRNALRAVDMPVQLWGAADDEILPFPFYAQVVRRNLPHPPQMHVVEKAGHFDFLAPCSDILKQRAPMICLSKKGFDRLAFHRIFNAEVVAFFKEALAGG